MLKLPPNRFFRHDKVLKLDPDDVNGWYKKGYTLMKLKRKSEALKCYNKVLELDPDFGLAKEAVENLRFLGKQKS